MGTRYGTARPYTSIERDKEEKRRTSGPASPWVAAARTCRAACPTSILRKGFFGHLADIDLLFGECQFSQFHPIIRSPVLSRLEHFCGVPTNISTATWSFSGHLQKVTKALQIIVRGLSLWFFGVRSTVILGKGQDRAIV